MSARKLATIFILLQVSLIGFSQTRLIEGNVIAFNKYPLKNIEISAKKSKAKTTTDANGHFSIEVKEKDIVKIKNSLFQSFEAKISEDLESLNINLIYNESDRNNSKAIDNGYFTNEDLNFALENLFKENNVFSLYIDVYEAIKYAIPEASMVETAGGGKAFILRGKNSLTGNNYAIYLVNQVLTGNVRYIVPSEIRKIFKLPNAQSAMYGSSAGNGVICIETY